MRYRVLQVLSEDKVEFASTVDFDGAIVVTLSAVLQLGTQWQLYEDAAQFAPVVVRRCESNRCYTL
jgi:hypothetical protein